MDIGEIIAISIGIAALLLSVFRVRMDVVGLLKYRDERRDKQRAEKRADETVRQEQERRRRQEEQKRQRQDDCTHIWEQLTAVDGDEGSSLPLQYTCHLCAAAHDNVAIIDETNTYYDEEGEYCYSCVAKWHSYYPLPRKGLALPVPEEPHSQKCCCQTCQQQKDAVSAYAAAEVSTGGGYDDVDDLPF